MQHALSLTTINIDTGVYKTHINHSNPSGKYTYQLLEQKNTNFYLCTVHFEIYVVHSPTNALFINLVKSFKFTLKYTIISLLHVSVSNDHHQGALSVPN